MEYPLVSAIMLVEKSTTQNEIEKAIVCFESQTYPNKELILINCPFEIKSNPSIKSIQSPDKSIGVSRNYGLSECSGQIIAQFDCDYWYAPHRIDAQLSTMLDNNANVSMLSKTIKYSYNSGHASYNTNDSNAILSTMIFIRPNGIGYPLTNKMTEFGLLQQMCQAGATTISIDVPELACKLHYTSGSNAGIVINCGLSNEEFNRVIQIMKG